MTTTMQRESGEGSARDSSRFLVREMWATVAIVAMWLAVLFVGVFGGDMVFHGSDTSTTVMPSGVAVALFAAIGTGSVAKRVFGRKAG